MLRFTSLWEQGGHNVGYRHISQLLRGQPNCSLLGWYQAFRNYDARDDFALLAVPTERAESCSLIDACIEQGEEQSLVFCSGEKLNVLSTDHVLSSPTQWGRELKFKSVLVIMNCSTLSTHRMWWPRQHFRAHDLGSHNSCHRTWRRRELGAVASGREFDKNIRPKPWRIEGGGSKGTPS